MGATRAAQPVAAMAEGKTVVDKTEWRSASSRARFQAEPTSIQVSADDLDRIDEGSGRGGFFLLSARGTRWTQARLRLDPFVIEMDEHGELALRFTGRALWGRPVRAPRPLGTVEPGECIEVAVNLRWQSERSQTKYIDHVWRFQRLTSLTVGEVHWPTPERVIDMRTVLN